MGGWGGQEEEDEGEGEEPRVELKGTSNLAGQFCLLIIEQLFLRFSL